MLSMDQKDENAVKFEQLLDSARIQSSASLESISANELRQDVLDFILNNTKISNVIEELSHSEDASLAKDLTQMTENVCIEHFQVIADKTNTPVQFVVSQIFAEQLYEIVTMENSQNTGQRCQHLLSKKVKEKVKALLNIMTKMNATKHFDKVNFIKTLQKSNIPMEVIWLLNESSLFSFRSCFLSWYDDKNWLRIFSESIVSLSWHGDHEDVFQRTKILEVFLGDLLLIGYSEAPESQDIAEKTRRFLFEVIEHAEKRFENLAPEKLKNWLCLLEVIRELKDVPLEIISKFFQEILSEFLSKPFTDKITIQNAIACQNEWTFEFLNETIKRKYSQFVLLFRGVEIIEVLQHAVESFTLEPVNIKVLCHLTTLFLVRIEESYKLFEDFLAQSLSDCFQSCNFSQFHLILLLKRQASLEGNHISSTYSSWFEQTFVGKGSCLGMNTKKSIHFFFKSLTELVPYEKPDFLKVHIFKSPQIASKFKSYVDDYISLAKTRLADMNETLEDNTGLFSHGASNDEKTKAMTQAKDDVERCVMLYEQSGKIPTAIVEASIFRKPYFIGRFLPALLVRRDPSLEADSKTRLIEELERAGKIPAAILRSYKRRWEQFEGSSNDDKPRDDIQQLSDCLEKLPDLLIKIATGNDVDTEALLLWLSRVARKLKLIFGTSPQESAVEILRLDEAALNLDNACLQASYVVINIFCRACVAVQNETTSENAASNSVLSKSRWASKFVSIIVSFPRLVQTLLVHLWSTIFHEPNLLSDEHIHGLAAFICHLSCFQTCYKICLKNELHETFVGFIASEISLSSKNCARFFLRWCRYYLQYAMVHFESLTTDLTQLSTNGVCFVPETMLLKMEYLFDKLKFNCGNRNHALVLHGNEMDILTLVMKSLYDTGLLNEQMSLTFEQWLVWELRVDEDILQEDERLQYYNWRIYEKFLAFGSENDDTEYERMAKDIVSCLLDHWTSASHTLSSTEITVIKVLQNIVGLMNPSSSEPKDSDKAWFLEIFISRCEKIKKDENLSSEIHFRCEVLAFVRLATNLPPWLLISNFETDLENISLEKLKNLSEFLNENLKPTLFQESLVLPFDFTAHIFKIFLKFSKQEYEKERKQEEIFRSFITETPTVFASLISYWNQLKPIYYHRITPSGTLDQLQSYHAWLTNVLTGSEHYHFRPDFVNCEVGQSYAIFLHLLRRAKSFASKMEEFVPRLNKMVDSLLPLQSGKKIVMCLFDNIMAYLAQTALEQFKTISDTEKFWIDISTTILFHCPQVLCVFSQEVSQDIKQLPARKISFETNRYRFLSVVFFRIITCQERDVLQKKLPVLPFTQTLLLMYIECIDLYQNYSDATLSKQPMDVDTFVKITIFVKDFLRHTSTVVLQQTPELLCSRLPEDIRRYIAR